MDTIPAAAAAPEVPRASLRAEDHGPLAVLELTGWCGLLLVVVHVALAVVGLALSSVWPGVATVGMMLAFASFIALVPVLVIGWPLGVLTAGLLRREPRESRHVAVFALVGAVSCVLLCGVGRTYALDAPLVLLAAAEGALGAGGGRFLLGVARRRRARRWADAPSPVDAVVAA
ncbi:hypothetical protein [Cellulomonas sp. S1-8]|uniref:hypothetical protein n=1 Tax=Cellulomonas sp. S1-8 TaxID=2904790 RepID=UPI0022439786|nr:hypothetical protein [Cellulomonas sp. S1-8]UZN04462.1 hypothetical protein OKX07_05975 [Cellulomonas sp. S1-8]